MGLPGARGLYHYQASGWMSRRARSLGGNATAAPISRGDKWPSMGIDLSPAPDLLRLGRERPLSAWIFLSTSDGDQRQDELSASMGARGALRVNANVHTPSLIGPGQTSV